MQIAAQLFGGPLDGGFVPIDPRAAVLFGVNGPDDPPDVHHVYALSLVSPGRIVYVETVRDKPKKATKLLKGGLDPRAS